MKDIASAIFQQFRCEGDFVMYPYSAMALCSVGDIRERVVK